MANVFRTYDIRGIYPGDMNDELAYKVGRAIVKYFNVDSVALGHDHRLSSPSLHDSMIRGLLDQGADVFDLGMCSSPELYNYNVSNSVIGIMITASHNPKEYNGIKVNNYDGRMINYAGGLDEIEKIVVGDDFPLAGKRGNVTKVDYNDTYCDYLRDFLDVKKKIKIVVDTGNGIAGPTVDKIFAKVKNVEILPLFFNPNGSYPNHPANPAELDNLVEISSKVRETNADFGVAFDGDADRCVFLDERGVPISPDLFFCVIADFESKRYPKGTFYFDLWFSKVVKERMKELGCDYQVLPLGAANFREKLVLEGGVAASEISAHIMFSENYCQDDGFFAMIKAINYYSSSNKTMSAFIAPYMIYFSDMKNIRVEIPDQVIDKIIQIYSDDENAKMYELDGITVEFADYWFNIRKSNTEPLLRLRIEADTRELLESKMNELVKIIKESS
ncbi:MAG: phosphomannomutase/phosphoglucomutase [Nanoarchaeota archaeon]